jgi:hypothetical protein
LEGICGVDGKSVRFAEMPLAGSRVVRFAAVVL